MIRHIVLIRFKSSVDETKIGSLFDELHQIEDKVEGLLNITSGRSESPEQMDQGFLHGFVIDFDNWDGLQRYQDHPEHQVSGAKLVANTVSGKDDIMVFDLPFGIASTRMLD